MKQLATMASKFNTPSNVYPEGVLSIVQILSLNKWIPHQLFNPTYQHCTMMMRNSRKGIKEFCIQLKWQG